MSDIFDWAATDRDFPAIVGTGRGHLLEDEALSLDEVLEASEAIRQLPERSPMEVSGKLPDVITPDVVHRFVFGDFRKTTTTRISEFTVPPGTPFETPEGLKAEDEECRIAVDAQGGVYPIRQSIFEETYEKV